MPGRKRKPTALKVIQGTVRKDRILENEATFPPIDPSKPPEGLSARALESWHRIAPDLHAAGVLQCADVTALCQLCDALATYEDAHDEIARTGYFVTSPGGIQKIAPAVFLRNHAGATAQKLFVEFGMTPAARSRVAGKAPKARCDDWDGF